MIRNPWRLGAMLAMLGLGACSGLNAENYGEKLAKEYCRYSDECFKSYFVEEYDDVGECTEEFVENNEDYYEDLADDCDFDEDKARDCLDSIREATRSCDYDDIEDDCFEVWDC